MTSKFKCHLLSDIHLEFPGTFEKLPPIPNDAPYLFLVGDIGYPADEDYQTFLLEQSKRYKGVFVVAGNHEFYTSTYQQAKRDIQKICQKNLYFMDQTSMLVDGFRILGTTLWSFVPDIYANEVARSINDYRHIGVENDNSNIVHRLTVSETNAFHRNELEWLIQEIKKATLASEPVIILTHHAPTIRNTIHAKDDSETLNCISYTDLEYLMKSPIVGWCFGHTHFSSDQIINGVRVISNQLGYLMMNEPETAFNDDLLIEFSTTNTN